MDYISVIKQPIEFTFVMDYISVIKQPIESELDDFVQLFNESLSHTNGLLQQVLDHIRKRAGKRMRPMLILLMAKNFGRVTEYDNKVAVLVGDYILSTALLYVSRTHSEIVVRYLSELGRTLSNGEILQLSNIQNEEISEQAYYRVIQQKTAALFEACASIGALSAGASEDDIHQAKLFGSNLGMIFQIRDDIFDYYDNSDIGKPTGNDMTEGKLTLPVIYALNTTRDADMLALARKVKSGDVSREEIERLVEFTKQNGGIEYAEKKMWEIHAESVHFLESEVTDPEVRRSLRGYLDYVIERTK